jgi:DNA-binding transcriptional regulator YhcF (GntR family)
MSTETMALVLRAKIERPSWKAVLMALAEHAGPDGSNAHPSVERMAIYTGLGESTIRQKLGELRDEGLISVQDGAHQHLATCYVMNVDRLRQMMHPRILEMDETNIRTARYGRQNQTSSSQRSGRQTSSSSVSDLQIAGPDLQITGPDLQQLAPNLLTINPEPSEGTGGRQLAAPQTLWVQVLGQLQRKFSKSGFETWLRDTQVVSQTDDEIIVGTANPYAMSWLQEHASKPAEVAIEKMAGRPMSLRFVVLERANARIG